jgi:hypothetical protein
MELPPSPLASSKAQKYADCLSGWMQHFDAWQRREVDKRERVADTVGLPEAPTSTVAVVSTEAANKCDEEVWVSEASTVASDCCSCGLFVDRQLSEDSVGHIFSDSTASAELDLEESDEEESREGAALPLVALRQALALKDDLLEAVSAPSFQARVQTILREDGSPDSSLRLCPGRERLCEESLGKTLPRHGFGSGPEGLQEALETLLRVALESEEILDGLLAVYDCLGLMPPALLIGAAGDLPWN